MCFEFAAASLCRDPMSCLNSLSSLSCPRMCLSKSARVASGSTEDLVTARVARVMASACCALKPARSNPRSNSSVSMTRTDDGTGEDALDAAFSSRGAWATVSLSAACPRILASAAVEPVTGDGAGAGGLLAACSACSACLSTAWAACAANNPLLYEIGRAGWTHEPRCAGSVAPG